MPAHRQLTNGSYRYHTVASEHGSDRTFTHIGIVSGASGDEEGHNNWHEPEEICMPNVTTINYLSLTDADIDIDMIFFLLQNQLDGASNAPPPLPPPLPVPPLFDVTYAMTHASARGQPQRDSNVSDSPSATSALQS